MGTAAFPMPADIRETVRLLNATNAWGLSLVEQDGRIHLLSGDQPIYVADTKEEAGVFLAGCFQATYMGKSLRQIREEIEGGVYGQEDGECPDLLHPERRSVPFHRPGGKAQEPS